MQHVTRMASLTAGLLVIAAGVAMLTARPTEAQPNAGPRVTVINKDTEPVPTKIVNSVPLEATVSGPVTANLNVSDPLPIRTVGREPMTQSGVMTLEDGNRVASESVMVVPAGKRFVIEFVSFSAGTEVTGSQFCVVNFALNAGNVFHIGTVEVEGNKVRSQSEHMGIYVREGTSISVRAYRAAGQDGDVPVRYAFSGYLEDE